MPLYEYHCNACGADTEILHKVSDPAPRKCPECGKSKLVRHVSAAGFRLGGGGWYETDFKSGSDKKRNLAGDKGDAPVAAATTSSDQPAAKSEAKPAAKSETKAESKSDKKPVSKSAKPKASA